MLVGVGRTRRAQYIYSPQNTTTDVWSAGTNWSSSPNPPVSDPTTQLTFVASNSTVLANSLNNTNTDDISGAFSLNILDLQGTGPATGAGKITIANTPQSTGLNFVTNVSNPVVNLAALNGTAGLTYAVTAPISLSNDTTFQGSGTATFNFSGAISGSSQLIKAGTSTLTLSGSNSGFSGNVTVNGGGAIRLTNSGALGSSPSVTLNYPTTSGGTGSFVDLQGSISLPSTATLNMTASSSGSNSFRSALQSSSGTNTWAGPITVAGNTGSVDQFYANGGNLNINGNISAGTGGMTGTVFLRGSGNTGTINGKINIPSGLIGKTDTSTWLINSTGNSWSGTGVYVGTLKIGAPMSCPSPRP